MLWHMAQEEPGIDPWLVDDQHHLLRINEVVAWNIALSDMLHIACILLDDDDDNEDLISCDDGGSGPVVLPNLP